MSLLDAPWTIDFCSGIPAYKQIVHRVQAAIADGRLVEGSQLPTVRALHQKLGINPNTVAKAYRELELAGAITTQQGSGCYVAPVGPSARLPAREKRDKLDELASRFTAEAESHGISFAELVKHLTAKNSP
jgi:GntR family transcriptional regulator